MPRTEGAPDSYYSHPERYIADHPRAVEDKVRARDLAERADHLETRSMQIRLGLRAILSNGIQSDDSGVRFVIATEGFDSDDAAAEAAWIALAEEATYGTGDGQLDRYGEAIVISVDAAVAAILNITLQTQLLYAEANRLLDELDATKHHMRPPADM